LTWTSFEAFTEVMFQRRGLLGCDVMYGCGEVPTVSEVHAASIFTVTSRTSET